ncbi:hypothetical protein DW083_09565 [Parabacteroides sp. AF48-14]|uniref:hypothetical protein n=1 Tax=Parabacteroides sp. AF48-14 TaxID=2292052 RepID=UPI000EFF277A|nr:hypothetical protein [Parabacteroides sp. AF48-14]RHO72132.1 hypothetical protein DW083_09565 [Parabacteroides sp. AF48-14]
MELEDLKKGWREIDEHIDRMDENNEMAQRVVREHIVSVRERLKNRFRRMTLLCLMAPGVINLLFLEIDGIGSWTKFAFLFFFIVMAIHKGFLWRGLAKTDYKWMTSKEALISTFKLEKFQKVGILIGFPLALVVIALFMLDLYRAQEMYAFYGACCGMVVGFFAGFRMQRRIRKEFQQLRGALEEELS